MAPPSKSHEHRLLIANFLAGERACLEEDSKDAEDIRATKRCLRSLGEPTATPVLDCGESGSTLRFLAPLAAALGKRPEWVRRGRLAERPFLDYPKLERGLHELAGDVSSQFVTGLLFALPLLAGDSRIRFKTPLESRGYVDMTLRVIRGAGIAVREVPNGFDVAGGQSFRPQSHQVEGDWSGAAFWYAMNALGSDISVLGLTNDSAQPDRAIVNVLRMLVHPSEKGVLEVDARQFPDIFPVLTVVAAAQCHETRFVGIRRLRLKECDRVAAMADVLERFGRAVEVKDDSFQMCGKDELFRGGDFISYGDHRIAMSIAVGATRADGPVTIDDAACAAKSYPAFFDVFSSLDRA